jgi:nicotinamidase-related amidase
MAELLPHGPLDPARTMHLCVDMQGLIAQPESPWHAPWAERILPQVIALTEPHAAQTVFTRFMPPAQPAQMPGAWQCYYRTWRDLTRERIDPQWLALMPPLGRFVPPALLLDKPVYSAFSGQRLQRSLAARGIAALVISGAETDICVLATVLGAVDRGYRVVLAADALCSAVDQTHDALFGFYRQRLQQQVELADTASILAAWR